MSKLNGSRHGPAVADVGLEDDASGASAHLIVLDSLGDVATLGPLIPDATVETAAGLELADEEELARLADLRTVTFILPGDAGPNILARVRAARDRAEPIADTVRILSWPSWIARTPFHPPAGLDSPGALLAWLLALPELDDVRPRPSANGNGHGTTHATAAAGDDGPDDDEGEIVDRWPKPQPLAFHGLAGDIVRALDPHTEADPVAVLIQLLVGFGNMIGKRPHFAVGATKHRLNLFAALVGPTASGRKGTAWDMAKFALEPFDVEWVTRRVQGGLVSGEGLIFHVRDEAYEWKETKGKRGERKRERFLVDAGVDDKRLMVLETEMGRVLKAMSRDSNTLSDVIRQAWDRDTLAAMGKNKGCISTGAHISIIGHITRADVSKHMTREDSSNGFANRFLWLAVRRSKELPDGGDIYSPAFEAEWEPIKHRLEGAIAYAREVDRMQRDVDAGRMWRGVYGELTGGKPGLLGAVLNRAEAQVMRLACVYALLGESCYVHPEHLMAALALWEYCEDSARYTFGDAFVSPAAEKLLEELRKAPDGLTRTQITNDVFGKHKKRPEINGLLSEMLTEGLIHREKTQPKKGPPVELWRAGKGAGNHAAD